MLQEMTFKDPFQLKLCMNTKCLGLKDRCLLRKAEASLEMADVNPLSLNYYNFKIKELRQRSRNRNNSSLLVCVNIKKTIKQTTIGK